LKYGYQTSGLTDAVKEHILRDRHGTKPQTRGCIERAEHTRYSSFENSMPISDHAVQTVRLQPPQRREAVSHLRCKHAFLNMCCAGHCSFGRNVASGHSRFGFRAIHCRTEREIQIHASKQSDTGRCSNGSAYHVSNSCEAGGEIRRCSCSVHKSISSIPTRLKA
jgi:hypothetical protein